MQSLPTIVWPRFMSSRPQRSTRTAVPTVRKVKSPTILQLIVRANPTPVAIIHPHQRWVNGLVQIPEGIEQVRRTTTVLEGSNLLITKLRELDVRIYRAGHEENELGIEQDEPGLRDMGVVCVAQLKISDTDLPPDIQGQRLTEDDKSGGQKGHQFRITTLPHDSIDNRYRETSQDSWQRP